MKFTASQSQKPSMVWYNNTVATRARTVLQTPAGGPNLMWRFDMASISHTQPYGVVYLITNTVTGGVYVGLTTNPRKRWPWHKCELRADRHPNPHLQRSWNKHGADAFVFSVAQECAGLDELNAAEIVWIDRLRAEGVRLYNQRAGGAFGGESTPEMRRKQGDAIRGRKRAPDFGALISERTTGVRKTVTPKLLAKWEAQRAPEDPERTARRIAAMVAKQPIVVFRAPNGDTYETQNVAEFAVEHGLHPRLLHYVVSGKQRHHRGWTLVARKEVPA